MNTLQFSDSPLHVIKFSYFKKNLFAVSGDDGVVSPWDVNLQGMYHAFDRSKHQEACKGVAFSPTNELLLCSAGLDAKIQFFDVVEKKTVKDIQAHEAITSLSFYIDGITIAAGTVSGVIYVYNLKDFKIKAKLDGDHTSEIKYLEFKRPYKKSKEKKRVTQPSKAKVARTYKEMEETK